MDEDIIAYALRKAIHDQEVAREWRQREGNKLAADGCAARLVRLRRALDDIDARGAV